MQRVPVNLAMWQVSPAMGPLKLHGAKRWWDMTLKCPRFQWRGGHQDQVGCGHRPLGWSDAKRRCWLRIDSIRTLGGTFPCHNKVFHKVLVPKGECQWIVTCCNHSETIRNLRFDRFSKVDPEVLADPSWHTCDSVPSEDRAYCMELTYNYGTWDRRSSDRCRTSLGYNSACRGRCCKARKFLEF
jgi:hypothetical protein